MVSHWWIGVSLLESSPNQKPNWFSSSYVNMVGDGQKTRFWHEVWVVTSPLCVSFERLFLILEQKTQVVGSMGSWVEDAWV